MRFFSTVLVAFSALATFVSAQSGSGNPVTSPTAGDRITAGQQTTIVWTPTTPRTDSVTLTLRRGDANNLSNIAAVASNIPNSGSFTWSVPATVPAGTDYTIEITWTNGVNYSPRFTIISTVTATSSASRTSTTGTATTSSASVTTTLLTSSITPAPNSTLSTTLTISSTSRPRTTSSNNGTTDDDVPRNNGASAVGATTFGMLACIAGAMAYLA